MNIPRETGSALYRCGYDIFIVSKALKRQGSTDSVTLWKSVRVILSKKKLLSEIFYKKFLRPNGGRGIWRQVLYDFDNLQPFTGSF
jgi:hypothetical protein